MITKSSISRLTGHRVDGQAVAEWALIFALVSSVLANASVSVGSQMAVALSNILAQLPTF